MPDRAYRGLGTMSPDRECTDLELASIVLLGCACFALIGIAWVMQTAGGLRRRLL
jgi:hypothetical protein